MYAKLASPVKSHKTESNKNKSFIVKCNVSANQSYSPSSTADSEMARAKRGEKNIHTYIH